MVLKSISRKKALVIVALCSLGLFGVYGLSIMGLSRMATPGAKASVVFGPDAPDSAIFSLSLKISAVVAIEYI